MIELDQPGHSKTPTSVDTGAEPTSTSSHDLQECRPIGSGQSRRLCV